MYNLPWAHGPGARTYRYLAHLCHISLLHRSDPTEPHEVVPQRLLWQLPTQMLPINVQVWQEDSGGLRMGRVELPPSSKTAAIGWEAANQEVEQQLSMGRRQSTVRGGRTYYHVRSNFTWQRSIKLKVSNTIVSFSDVFNSLRTRIAVYQRVGRLSM